MKTVEIKKMDHGFSLVRFLRIAIACHGAIFLTLLALLGPPWGLAESLCTVPPCMSDRVQQATSVLAALTLLSFVLPLTFLRRANVRRIVVAVLIGSMAWFAVLIGVYSEYSTIHSVLFLWILALPSSLLMIILWR